MGAWLETENGDRIPLASNFAIGRAAQNTLALPGDPRVSRRHALIHQQSGDQATGQIGEYWLVDLGSSNGVFIHGKRIRQSTRLKDQDRIEIGSNRFKFLQTEDTSPPGETSFVTLKDQAKTEDLWLLVADIEGFTPLSQKLAGDMLARIVGSWTLGCKDIIEAQSGDINKYLGDGYLAFWPETDVTVNKIVGTVQELKKFQQRIGEFKFRVVVHYGAITLDNTLPKTETNLIGPQVNFLFRMEKLAGSLREHCLLSARAAEQFKAFGPVRSVGQHPLNGFEGTFEFFAF